MPKWFAGWFRCRGCEAREAEIQRLLSQLSETRADIKSLTDQLLAKNDPVTHRALNPPQAQERRRPAERQFPAYISSLLTGGHLRLSLDEIANDHPLRFGSENQ